jgi:hypothetical protein
MHQIRLLNLESLIKKQGSAAKIANLIGSSPTVLSVIRSDKHPDKNMGGGMARRIEDALSLPHGWMDRLHDDEEAVPINISALINVATPTYLNTLQQIQNAQDAGVLEESDKAMLKIIADKYKDRLCATQD